MITGPGREHGPEHRMTVPSPGQLFDCLRGTSVTAIVVAMIIILAVVAGTAGMVVVGIEGRFKERAPKLADTMARAAQHLNGDGRPPEALTRLRL